VLAFIESGASDDFPLPINIGNRRIVARYKGLEEEVCRVPHSAAGQSRQRVDRNVVMVCRRIRAGRELVYCAVIQVTCRENPVLQPLVDLFVRCYAEWTGNDWSTGRVEQHADKQV
jgi:hypothetical protein